MGLTQHTSRRMIASWKERVVVQLTESLSAGGSECLMLLTPAFLFVLPSRQAQVRMWVVERQKGVNGLV